MSRSRHKSQHQSVFNPQLLNHVHVILPHQVGLVNVIDIHDKQSIEPGVLVVSPPFSQTICVKCCLKHYAWQVSFSLSLFRFKLLAHFVRIIAQLPYCRLTLSCFRYSAAHLSRCHEFFEFLCRARLARQSKIITIVKHNKIIYLNVFFSIISVLLILV